MRTVVTSCLLVLALATPAWASGPSDAFFENAGLDETSACYVFIDASAVEYRKDRWRRAIDALWQNDADYLLSWIIGRVEPPAFATKEATRQRDCLIERLVRDAADTQTRLIVDYQKYDAPKTAMPALGNRFEGSRAFRMKLQQELTTSAYRDSNTQARIWKRKFVFSGRPFNAVSSRAAPRCGLPEGDSWKPDDATHRSCWGDRLTAIDREREILRASAAPGISRHHWGTDFDLFSLNPAMFRTGRYADEYLWMTHNAVQLGFVQPYSKRQTRGERYMEERWHWSYYPVAQALLEFAADNQQAVGDALEDQWSGFEQRWNGRRGNTRYFDFVRAHWREFMFNVDSSAVRE